MAYSQKRWDTLLELLRSGKNVKSACIEVGITEMAISKRVNKNPAFAKEYIEATASLRLKEQATESQWDILLDGLRTGLNIADACTRAGMNKQTYYNRINSAKRARENGMPVDDFDIRAAQARLVVKQSMLSIVQKSALGGAKVTIVQTEKDGSLKRDKKTGDYVTKEITILSNWHAAAWILERMYPTEFGRVFQSAEDGDGDALGADDLQNILNEAAKNSPLENPEVLAQQLANLGIILPNINPNGSAKTDKNSGENTK